METDYYEGATHLFMRALGDVKIDLAQPEMGGRQTAMRATVRPDRYAKESTCFVRIAPGEWLSSTATEQPDLVRFQASGQHTVDVCVLIMGSKVYSTSCVVTAEVTYPNTLMSDGPAEGVSATNFLWVPPVRLEPSGQGGGLDLAWRVDTGAWKMASSNFSLDLSDLTNGVYTLTLAASEDRFWADPTPLELRVRVEIDLEKRVERLIANLTAEDPAKQEAARQVLTKLGPEAAFIVDRRIIEMEREARTLSLLRQIRRQMEFANPSPFHPTNKIPRRID